MESERSSARRRWGREGSGVGLPRRCFPRRDEDDSGCGWEGLGVAVAAAGEEAEGAEKSVAEVEVTLLVAAAEVIEQAGLAAGEGTTEIELEQERRVDGSYGERTPFEDYL
jgi:hypothetical protein